MSGETLYIVMKVTQAAVPVAWRLTETEANEARDALTAAHRQVTPKTYAHFFVMPVTNE